MVQFECPRVINLLVVSLMMCTMALPHLDNISPLPHRRFGRRFAGQNNMQCHTRISRTSEPKQDDSDKHLKSNFEIWVSHKISTKKHLLVVFFLPNENATFDVVASRRSCDVVK